MLSTKLRTGIVDLPNVGKSTLFNALAGGSVAKVSGYGVNSMLQLDCYVLVIMLYTVMKIHTDDRCY